MPKPENADIGTLKEKLAKYKESNRNGDYAGAQQILLDARRNVTDNEKLQGGKGAYFQVEAVLTALMGQTEFDQGNIKNAASRWQESFEIEYAGLGYQQKVDQHNAKIADLLVTIASAAATAAVAQKSGSSYYTYTVPNTVIPTPAMIAAGRPQDTVYRIPIRVEGPPFDNVVKLKNKKGNYCTAMMVSKRVAISAAHCLSHNGEPIDPALLTIKREDILNSQSNNVKKYYTHIGENKGWDATRRNDWVVLVTEKPYDRNGPFPEILQSIPESIVRGKEKVMLAGYSSDVNKGYYLTLHYACAFKVGQKSPSGTYLTNCENAKGSSGGAVMTSNAPYKVVAIHTAQLVNPSDDYYSVETFTPDFVSTALKVISENKGIF